MHRRGNPVEQPPGARPGEAPTVGPGPERPPAPSVDGVDAGLRGSVLRRQLVLVAVGEGAVLMTTAVKMFRVSQDSKISLVFLLVFFAHLRQQVRHPDPLRLPVVYGALPAGLAHGGVERVGEELRGLEAAGGALTLVDLSRGYRVAQ